MVGIPVGRAAVIGVAVTMVEVALLTRCLSNVGVWVAMVGLAVTMVEVAFANAMSLQRQ